MNLACPFQVANNAGKAEAITEEADRLEDVAQKVQAQTGAHTSGLMRTVAHMPTDTQLIASESTGVISISVASQTLGQIKYASQAACRLLGYTRTLLERRNLNVIIPSPIAEAQCVWIARVVLVVLLLISSSHACAAIY